MCHHKAPHRPWEPDDKHADMYEDEDIRVPDSFDDDYKNKAKAAAAATMRMTDLTPTDLKEPIPEGLTPEEEKHWRQCAYYRYWVNQDGSHNVFAHYGIRTKTHKLIYFYNKGCGTLNANPGTEEPEWELFDLEKDPLELFNEYNTPEYQDKVKELTLELNRTMARIGDIPLHKTG